MKLFWTEPAIQGLCDLRDPIAADFIASIISRHEPEQASSYRMKLIEQTPRAANGSSS
jgi:hypothetical protein